MTQRARTFSDEIRVQGGLPLDDKTQAILAAFEAVSREAFTFGPPWRIKPGLKLDSYLTVQEPEVSDLDHCVLIALQEEDGINIGEPSFWSRMLYAADVEKGARVVQVGAGTGYYSAILSHLVGEGMGSVIALEIELKLIAKAKEALADRENVTVIHGAGFDDLVEKSCTHIIAFAGVTNIPPKWVEILGSGGIVIAPFTGESGWGAMVKLMQNPSGFFSGEILGSCGFYPCQGARTARQARRIDKRIWSGALSQEPSFPMRRLRDGSLELPL